MKKNEKARLAVWVFLCANKGKRVKTSIHIFILSYFVCKVNHFSELHKKNLLFCVILVQ